MNLRMCGKTCMCVCEEHALHLLSRLGHARWTILSLQSPIKIIEPLLASEIRTPWTNYRPHSLSCTHSLHSLCTLAQAVNGGNATGVRCNNIACNCYTVSYPLLLVLDWMRLKKCRKGLPFSLNNVMPTVHRDQDQARFVWCHSAMLMLILPCCLFIRRNRTCAGWRASDRREEGWAVFFFFYFTQ